MTLVVITTEMLMQVSSPKKAWSKVSASDSKPMHRYEGIQFEVQEVVAEERQPRTWQTIVPHDHDRDSRS